MKRGDIHMVSPDPSLRREQQGSRLLLIVSPLELNEATRLPEVRPIASGSGSGSGSEFARRIGFAVPITR